MRTSLSRKICIVLQVAIVLHCKQDRIILGKNQSRTAMLYLPVKGEVANFLSLQCLCGRGMVLTLIVVLATFVLVRSEECFYEYNYGTGYMDYWCDDSYATFDEYVPDVTAPPSPPPTPPPPPPAFPTNHCRGGLPILSNQGRGGGGFWGVHWNNKCTLSQGVTATSNAMGNRMGLNV